MAPGPEGAGPGTHRPLECMYCWTLQVYLNVSFFPGTFVHDAFGVVVAQPATQLVVVHLWLVLARPPELGYALWLLYLELVALASPGDELFLVWHEQQVQEELPELDGAPACWDCVCVCVYMYVCLFVCVCVICMCVYLCVLCE